MKIANDPPIYHSTSQFVIPSEARNLSIDNPSTTDRFNYEILRFAQDDQ